MVYARAMQLHKPCDACRYLDKLNFADERTPSAGMQKGARLEPTERTPSPEVRSLADSSMQFTGGPPDGQSEWSQGANSAAFYTSNTPSGEARHPVHRRSVDNIGSFPSQVPPKESSF